jgi:flagellar hook-basal body complex protein FliE
MSDLKINGLQQGLTNLVKNSAIKPKGGFEEMMNDVMGKLSEIEKETEKAVNEFASGGDISTAIIAMQKAELSFQVMIEVRNRLLNAYEEIMRMQV